MTVERTLREARDRYFRENGFGADGGYGAKWVDFKLGPIPMPFPNTPSRVRAVRYHDLHHVLTGYATSFTGEVEISAWEIAAGCKDMTAAWVLNLSGMASGLFFAPGRVFRAFLRGRRSETLYAEPYEPLLNADPEAVRAKHVGEAETVRPGDVVLFASACLAGFAIGLLLFAMVLALLPFGLLASALRPRDPAATRAGG